MVEPGTACPRCGWPVPGEIRRLCPWCTQLVRANAERPMCRLPRFVRYPASAFDDPHPSQRPIEDVPGL
jgi:hypothetical protein